MQHLYHFIAPATPPSSFAVVSKTATTITVGWTPFDSTSADGYGFYVYGPNNAAIAARTDNVSQSTFLFWMLTEETPYNITIRAFKQLIGPASTITVETSPGKLLTEPILSFFYFNSYYFNKLDYGLTHYTTQ